MQQIPHDSPHRESIVAGEGRKFVVADYSQIELRIAAKYVPDDNPFLRSTASGRGMPTPLWLQPLPANQSRR
jgi:DNA polymerase I-like protein with 3'-5' exonuclease and polymerase domains